MANYIEKINKLAAVIGVPVNFVDQVPIRVLKDEIAQLTSTNIAKRRAIDLITDEMDKMKAQIDFIRDEELSFEEEMAGNHQRTNILKRYMETIESSDTFLPNKVAREIEDHISSIYDPMMELHDRRSEITKQLADVRNLQTECDELRRQVEM